MRVTVTTTKNARKILEAAAAFAESVDHCKGKLYERGSNMEVVGCCALGALDHVANDGGLISIRCRFDAEIALRIVVEKTCGDPSVPRWNDLRTTTKQDVVAMLKKAAELCPSAP
jgi:hypothetical protein